MPTRENYKRDLQKRPTKETYKRDLQKKIPHIEPRPRYKWNLSRRARKNTKSTAQVVAQNLESISKTLTTYQNSANGIYY